MDKKSRQIQQKYDNASYIATYDRRYRSLQFKKMALLFSALRLQDGQSGVKDLHPAARPLLLDFGAGTGLLWDFYQQKYADHVNHIQWIAIDISRGMLTQFRNKLEPTMPRGVNFICCDGGMLPFREKIFDNSYAFTTLQNLDDPTGGLIEIDRVMQNGGWVALSWLKKAITLEKLNHMLARAFGDSSLLERISENDIPERNTIDFEQDDQTNTSAEPLEDFLHLVQLRK